MEIKTSGNDWQVPGEDKNPGENTEPDPKNPGGDQRTLLEN
ncbi:hypothetical protein [Mycoplasmopsis bovis]|nr:hypothetical protein [Mycoplasmopsis bovis]